MNGNARYAIGLVRLPEELHAALDDLLTEPRPPHQLKVIACQEPLAEAMRRWQGEGRDAGVCEWLVSRPATQACPWRFEPLEPGQHPSSPAAAAPLPGFHLWVLDRHKHALDDHLRGGGGLLIASSSSDAEERAAWTTLLRHRSGGLQTYDMPTGRER